MADLTVLEILKVARWVRHKADYEDLYDYLDKHIEDGMKLKDVDDCICLIVNKTVNKKKVKKVIRGYFDHVMIKEKLDKLYDISDIPKETKDSIFDVYRDGKTWTIELDD